MTREEAAALLRLIAQLFMVMERPVSSEPSANGATGNVGKVPADAGPSAPGEVA